VRGEFPDMSLDAITCSRDDINVTTLSCDLTLSAFFKRGGHG
jgi:hypothetical protein